MTGSRDRGFKPKFSFAFISVIANFAKEQTKYDLGSREQKGHFRTEAESMGLPLQSPILHRVKWDRQMPRPILTILLRHTYYVKGNYC